MPTFSANSSAAKPVGRLPRSERETVSRLIDELKRDGWSEALVIKHLRFVHKSKITDQASLLKIATFAAQQNPLALASAVRYLAIESAAARLEIAKIAVTHADCDLSHLISNFDLLDEKARIRLAKAAAKSEYQPVSRCLAHYQIQDEAALIAIAKLAAVSDPLGLVKHIQFYQIQDQSSLIEIAKVAALSASGHVSKFIQNFGISDESARIEIAMIAAKTNGSELAGKIQNYGIRDHKARVKIAKIAAANAFNLFAESIGNFAIPDEADRIAVAKIAAGKVHSDTIQNIYQYNISDRRAIYAIAKIAATANGEYFSECFNKSIADKKAAVLRLATLAAASDGGGTARHFDNYGITNEGDRVKIAWIAVQSKNVRGFSESLYKFEISSQETCVALLKEAASRGDETGCVYLGKDQSTDIDQESLVEIVKLIASNNSVAVSNNIGNLRIKKEADRIEIAKIAAANLAPDKTMLVGKYKIKDPNANAEIARIAITANPRMFLELDSFYIDSEDVYRLVIGPLLRTSLTSLTENQGKSVVSEQLRILRLLRVLASTDSFYLCRVDPEFVCDQDLWRQKDPHERLEQVVQSLVRLDPRFDARLLSYKSEEKLQAEDIVFHALAATIVAWDISPNTVNKSREGLAVVSGLANLTRKPLSPNSARLLYGTLLSAVEMLGEAPGTVIKFDDAAWSDREQCLRLVLAAATLKALGGSVEKEATPLDRKAVGEKLQEYKVQVGAAFSNLLGVGNGNLAIELAERWGDLLPFTVLAARFRSVPNWRKELPVLSEIATHVLDDSFVRWKYSRDQLRFLTPKSLAGWQKNPFTFEQYRVTSSTTQVDRVAKAKEIFEHNLLRHLPLEVARTLDPVSPSDLETVAALDDALLAKFPRSFAEGVSFIKTALDSGAENQLRLICKSVNMRKKALLGDLKLSGDIRTQLAEDLSALSKALEITKVSAATEYIIFSTITDDPKLLLTVGDLVDTSSCQNFRSGSHIDALPGYVMDGNIKVALSYAFTKNQLDHILGNSFKDEEFVIAFDAPRQTLVFTGKSSGTTVPFELPKAVHRRILRLGHSEDTGAAMLLTEIAYVQSHGIQSIISEKVAALINSFMKESGIKPAAGTVKFPGSRNPGGVYSDFGGGSMIGEYDFDVYPQNS